MPDNGPRTRHATGSPGVRFSRGLSQLYFVRTGVSLVWVTGLALLSASIGSGSSLAPPIRIWLVLYPVIDVAATAVDIHTTPPDSRSAAQRANRVVGLFAAAALAAATTRGLHHTIEIFGLWAVAAGAIQIVVAVRRNALLRAQSLMALSGVGSIVAGITYLTWSGTAHAGLTTLIQYSAGGALWYLLTAIWLLHPRRPNPAPGGSILSE